MTALDNVMELEPAPKQNRHRFGRMDVDGYKAVWEKDGSGKATLVPYNEEFHKDATPFTHMEFRLLPLCGEYAVVRSANAPDGKEWKAIIKPSLAALDSSPSAVNGKFVQVEEAPTGKKGTNRRTGEEIDYTTFKFVAVYGSEQECSKAADEFFAGIQSAPAVPAPTPEQPKGGSLGMSKEAAFKVVEVFWRSCKGDVAVFEGKLRGMPAVAAHFSIESPEVLELISK